MSRQVVDKLVQFGYIMLTLVYVVAGSTLTPAHRSATTDED